MKVKRRKKETQQFISGWSTSHQCTAIARNEILRRLIQSTSWGVREIMVLLKHHLKYSSGQACLRSQVKLEYAWGRLTRKVIIKIKNVFYEKKVKQFDSCSVMYLTPRWGEYRKQGKEKENASYIKLSQAQTACKAGMIIQTLSSDSTGSVIYFVTFGFSAQITRICKEGATSLKGRKKMVLLECQTIFHSFTRVHLSAKLTHQQFHDEVSI